jgi:hypothetical protein
VEIAVTRSRGKGGSCEIMKGRQVVSPFPLRFLSCFSLGLTTNKETNECVRGISLPNYNDSIRHGSKPAKCKILNAKKGKIRTKGKKQLGFLFLC